MSADLLELAAVDAVNAARWTELAERILISLCENYLITDARGPSSILRDGARSVPANYMEHGLIYGDYYFPGSADGRPYAVRTFIPACICNRYGRYLKRQESK